MDMAKLKPDKKIICLHVGIVLNSVFILSGIIISSMFLNQLYTSNECDSTNNTFSQEECKSDLGRAQVTQ
jgi:hypothetical protein